MGKLCKICRLPPELREAVDDMITDGLPGNAIQVWLSEHHIDISLSAISRHKRAHLGLLSRDFSFLGEIPNDCPEPLPLDEYSRRMSGYLQALTIDQARFVRDRQEAALMDDTEPDIDKPVTVLHRLVSIANMFMGFASTSNLDAAIEVLQRAGYTVRGMAIEQESETLPTFEEFKQWAATRRV